MCHVVGATYQTIPLELLTELLGGIPGELFFSYTPLTFIVEQNIPYFVSCNCFTEHCDPAEIEE